MANQINTKGSNPQPYSVFNGSLGTGMLGGSASKVKSAGTLQGLGPTLGNNALNLANSVAKARTTQPTTPQPSTPIKKVNNADGSSTEYHAPAKSTTSGVISPTKTTSSATPTTPATPTTTPFMNTINAGVGASAGTYGQGAENVKTGTGMISNQVNNANPNIATAQKGLLDIAQNQTPEVKAAQEQYNTFAKASPFLKGNIGNNVAAEVASGRGQIIGNILSEEQQALAQNMTNALAGQGQQITAGENVGHQALTQQGQAITGGTNIANVGATGQGQGIGGLGVAGTQLAPQVGQFGQTQYQPSEAGTANTMRLSGQPLNDVNNLASSVLNNTMSYDAAFTQLSSAYGSAVANQLLSTIQKTNPSFNVSSSTANVGTIGDLTTKVNNAESLIPAAVSNTQSLVEYSKQFAGNVPIVNGIKQLYRDVAQQNSAIAGFKTQLQTVRQAWTDILGTDPNIDDNISSTDLEQKLKSLQTTASKNVAGYKVKLGELTQSGSNTPAGSSTPSSGGGWGSLGD